MATTVIHAITSTPDAALRYCMADKVEVYQAEEEIHPEKIYELFEENGTQYIRYFTLNTGQNCNIFDPYSTFKDIQEKWQGVRYKNGGAARAKNGKEPLMWHLCQNFLGWETSVTTANEIGRKLAEEVFKGFSVTISTHCNTDNVHNHFLISAWGNDGRKWNDCHETKRLIRKVSDCLCEEYGLSVLEHTRDMNLVRYQDANGTTRYFEPTARKSELIRKRAAGENSTDDVRSYRNTPPYDVWKEKRKSNREEIQDDIEALLTSCFSYEDLLSQLRALGYRIKDKKKNGEWRAHITFQAPGHDKPTREDVIGENGFYTRENLAPYIQGRIAALKWEAEYDFEREEKAGLTFDPEVPYFCEYEYGKTNLASVSDDWKTICEAEDWYRTIERTPVEKQVLADIRIKDSQVQGLIDTTQLHKIIAEQNERRRQKKPYLVRTEEERLVAQIQSSFRCLQYAEKHGIYSYRQIIDLYAVSKAKCDKITDACADAEERLEKLKDVCMIPHKLAALETKIREHREDIHYILEDYGRDKRLAEQYRHDIKRYKIVTPEKQKLLEERIAGFEAKLRTYQKYAADLVLQMSELENCMSTFDRIDTERGCRDVGAVEEFAKISGKSCMAAQERDDETLKKSRRGCSHER